MQAGFLRAVAGPQLCQGVIMTHFHSAHNGESGLDGPTCAWFSARRVAPADHFVVGRDLPRPPGDAGTPRDRLPFLLRPGSWSAEKTAICMPQDGGRDQIHHMPLISEQLAEAADRAVPLTGKGTSSSE